MQPVKLSNVLHIPALQNNLLAVLHLTSHHGFKVIIAGSTMEFWQKNELIFTASIPNTAGFLNGSTPISTGSTLATAKVFGRQLWHRRLSHLSSDCLEQAISKNLAEGLVFNLPEPVACICEPCIAGKQHRVPFPHSASHRATELLEQIHSDLHEVSVPSGKREIPGDLGCLADLTPGNQHFTMHKDRSK